MARVMHSKSFKCLNINGARYHTENTVIDNFKYGNTYWKHI